MDAPAPSRMTYEKVRHLQQRVRAAEVPIEHAVSLPMPTLRWGAAGFGFFANPAVRNPEGPTQLGPPDRWWIIDACRGRLLIYALSSAMALDARRQFGPVEVHTKSKSIAELRQMQTDFDHAVDLVLDDFFAQRTAEPAGRQRVIELWQGLVVPPLWDIYRALAPDFFAWLET